MRPPTNRRQERLPATAFWGSRGKRAGSVWERAADHTLHAQGAKRGGKAETPPLYLLITIRRGKRGRGGKEKCAPGDERQV